MRDGGVRVDVVDPDVDAIILATVLRCDARAKERVNHRAIGVEDHPYRVEGGCWGHISRLRNDAQLAGLLVGDRKACAAGHEVGTAHILIQCAHVCERYPSGGNRAPQRGCRVHHGLGLLVIDRAVQRTLIDVVV